MRLVLFPVFAALSFVIVGGCASDTSGPSAATGDDALTGCQGKASSDVPASGEYYLTSFGESGGRMSCGSSTKNGSWYYAASRQRYGCGAHIKIEAKGKCVVAQTDDYGPDMCVEKRAGRPIIDASPMVAKYLFGVSSAGYSDRLSIVVTEVSSDTPLGPCSSKASGGDGSDDDAGAGNDPAPEDDGGFEDDGGGPDGGVYPDSGFDPDASP